MNDILATGGFLFRGGDGIPGGFSVKNVKDRKQLCENRMRVPWLRGWRVERIFESLLDEEMIAYYMFTLPTEVDVQAQQEIVSTIADAICRRYSYPTSSVGVCENVVRMHCILNDNDSDNNSCQFAKLIQQEWGFECNVQSANVLLVRRSDLVGPWVAVDFSKNDEIPAISQLISKSLKSCPNSSKVLVVLMRILYHSRLLKEELNNKSKDGMSLLALAALVIAVQKKTSTCFSNQSFSRPGVYLLEFLYFYGHVFNCDTHIMSLKGPIKRKSKNSDILTISLQSQKSASGYNLTPGLKWEKFRSLFKDSYEKISSWTQRSAKQRIWSPLSSVISHASGSASSYSSRSLRSSNSHCRQQTPQQQLHQTQPPASQLHQTPPQQQPPASQLHQTPPQQQPPASQLHQTPPQQQPPASQLHQTPPQQQPPASQLHQTPPQQQPPASQLHQTPLQQQSQAGD